MARSASPTMRLIAAYRGSSRPSCNRLFSWWPGTDRNLRRTRGRRTLSFTAGGRQVVCACSAPPRSWGEGPPLLDINDSSVEEYASVSGAPDDGSDVLIECRDVHKAFGDKQILSGVSFKIKYGEAVGIIGPSGTGKSTILKIMAGLFASDTANAVTPCV